MEQHNQPEKKISGLEAWSGMMGMALGTSLAIDHIKKQEEAFENIDRRIIINNDKAMRVPKGTLVETFAVNNSEIRIFNGGKLIAASATGSKFFVERGGSVNILKMDENSSIEEEVTPTNCPNCGGPSSGGGKCAYCGTLY